jgi:hypothetical protein
MAEYLKLEFMKVKWISGCQICILVLLMKVRDW